MRRELCVEVEHPPLSPTEWPWAGGPWDLERTEFQGASRTPSGSDLTLISGRLEWSVACRAVEWQEVPILEVVREREKRG